MENYIIRIYRYEKDNPRGMVGVVEEVGADVRMAFTSLEELWNILNLKYSRQGGEDRGDLGFGNFGGV